jgi:hypothetical protein
MWGAHSDEIAGLSLASVIAVISLLSVCAIYILHVIKCMCIQHIRVYGLCQSRMDSFTLRSLYHRGKCPQYPLDRRLGRPHSQSGHCGEEIILLNFLFSTVATGGSFSCVKR